MEKFADINLDSILFFSSYFLLSLKFWDWNTNIFTFIQFSIFTHIVTFDALSIKLIRIVTYIRNLRFIQHNHWFAWPFSQPEIVKSKIHPDQQTRFARKWHERGIFCVSHLCKHKYWLSTRWISSIVFVIEIQFAVLLTLFYVAFHRIVGNTMIKLGHWMRCMHHSYCVVYVVCVFFALDYSVIYAQRVNKPKLPKTLKMSHIHVAYVESSTF